MPLAFEARAMMRSARWSRSWKLLARERRDDPQRGYPREKRRPCADVELRPARGVTVERAPLHVLLIPADRSGSQSGFAHAFLRVGENVPCRAAWDGSTDQFQAPGPSARKRG